MSAVRPLCKCALVCSLVGFVGCGSATDGQVEALGRFAASGTAPNYPATAFAEGRIDEAPEVPNEVTAWASHVIEFSSQYDEYYWSAEEALGPPDTINYGYPTAWAPAVRNGTRESLTLGFDEPVHAHAVTVRETEGNGFLFQVDVLDVHGGSHTVWAGTDLSVPGTPTDLRLDFTATDFLVAGVRVHVNTDHSTSTYEEIDAIALHGTPAGLTDCNSNGVDDALELAAGSAFDCDFNDVPDACDSDGDGDGLIDACDACPDSDLADTLTLNGCDTGVANLPLDGGCWMSELLAACDAAGANHGRFVSCVAHLTNAWKRAGLLTGQERRRVQRCAAQSSKGRIRRWFLLTGGESRHGADRRDEAGRKPARRSR